MRVVTISPEINKARAEFFRLVFGERRGFVCIALRYEKEFHEEFFEYPRDTTSLLEYINRYYHGRNIYFCPQLLTEPKRLKGTIKECTALWADLDEADPSLITPPPSLVLETSPRRFQGLWLLEEPVDPMTGEDLSHRLAFNYKYLGVDQSGWDLTQLLRVPYTYNMKYSSTASGAPVVVMSKELSTLQRYSLQVFTQLPSVPGYEWTEEPMPDISGMDADEILQKYSKVLDPQVTTLYSIPPRIDWSAALWNLECLLIEAGLTKEEVYAVASRAACNKFARDGLSPKYLWQDVCRAYQRVSARLKEVLSPETVPVLLTPEEEERLRSLPPTFVEKYIEWAKSRGDAAPQYHEAGAFVILSQLLSGAVKLPTSFGIVVPNLWFMILADTTLTRKSTAMDMAIELLLEVDPDAVLATDGSLEGLMTGIALRPNRPGIFWRDEFSGLLEMIRKKDYYAGMIESLTKLYDGKYQKRILRKETIEIRDPILIIFCGGIRTRVLQLLDMQYVLSGFLPRFIFIAAESDLNMYQPIGPQKETQDTRRAELLNDLFHLKRTYDSEMTIHIGEQKVSTRRTWDAVLTEEAWERYNKFEKVLVDHGVESPNPELYTPTMDRLAKSGLKVAVLFAASRQVPKENVVVERDDVLRAIEYVSKWCKYSLDVVANVGKTGEERRLEQILGSVRRDPGIGRSKIMQHWHLTAREADWILETLEQRGQIRRVRDGRTEKLFPTVLR